MRITGLFFSALLIFAGFTACSPESNNNEATAAASATTEESNETVQTSAPQPIPNQPEYIRKAEELPKTTVSFATESYDFQKVPAGEKVFYKYKFTNTGSEDLVITYVKPSCGCTTPKWSQEPIKPGEEGFVDVEFDSRGKSGTQRKTVTLFGNFENGIRHDLKLTGEVVAE